jgi:hypothetical protein
MIWGFETSFTNYIKTFLSFGQIEDQSTFSLLSVCSSPVDKNLIFSRPWKSACGLDSHYHSKNSSYPNYLQ